MPCDNNNNNKIGFVLKYKIFKIDKNLEHAIRSSHLNFTSD